MIVARCVVCGDPPPNGWRYCRRCHDWHDMITALQYAGTIGIDEPKLQRALRRLSPRGPRHPTIAMFDKLVRRISELEYRVGAR